MDFSSSEAGKVSGDLFVEQESGEQLHMQANQDQLLSIAGFSPKWAYAGFETKVLITGKFLKSLEMIEYITWSCMFGDVEVPAKVVAYGILCCHTPKHEAGRVPFYVTCSNRVACSEVQEFEYRASHSGDMNTADDYSGETLVLRFGKLLSLSSNFTGLVHRESKLSSKINSLLMTDSLAWDELLKLSAEEEASPQKLKEELIEKLLKEKLRIWLLQKVAEDDGKGLNVFDEGGQGVLHFASALGYDWAFEPTIVSGVNVNLRDVNGWTALHWAASYGRERAVASLISLGADAGTVTDPSPENPLGRTPVDLASANGHKRLAEYLSEVALSSVLERLTSDNQEGSVAEPNELSLADTLVAVRNASQAASRIQHAFQEHSRKRRVAKSGDGKFGMSDEQVHNRDQDRRIPNIVTDIQAKKMKMERTIAAINLILELPSAVLEHLSSVNKRYTALVLMLLSFTALVIGITELAQKGKRRGWRWRNKALGPLQHSSAGKEPFWSFSNMVGFTCAIFQCMFSAINYALVLRRVHIQIQIAAMPIIFAFVQLWFKLRDKAEHSKSNLGEA